MMSHQEVTKIDLINIIRCIHAVIVENRDPLSKLDAEIGDGDHGFSMATGFTRFYENLENYAELSIGSLLKKGGFDLISSIGGAAGAIFGTFFKGQGSYYDTHLQSKNSLSLDDLARMMAEALAQIKSIGKADLGDKTMIDALEPAVNALVESSANNISLDKAFKNAAVQAEAGAENTRSMVGKRGRSKNLGERSLGFMDPGARSMALILKAYADYLEDKYQSKAL